MRRFMGWEVTEEVADYLKFLSRKIVPRLILAVVLSLLFSSLDHYASFNEVITFIIFFFFLIFFYLPPTIDTLYLLKKSGDPELDQATLLKLLQASKDSFSGVFALNGSLVIKSYYGQAVDYYEKLKEKRSFEGYEEIRQVKSRQGFQEEYCKLLETVTWKFVEERYGSGGACYRLSSIDAVEF